MKSSLEIQKIGKVSPSKDFREQAKKRLMQRIRQEESSWVENLLCEFQNIKPAENFRTISKERLIHKIANPAFFPNWVKHFFLNKKFISLATACGIMFVSIFSFSFYSPQTVEASNSVYLIISKGDPMIKQLGGNWEKAKQLQELRIGDTIQTDNNDIAEIHFFDNSVTRLANSTELTITTFLKKNYEETVELKLNEGRAWNKVIQASSDTSDFTVKTHNSSVSTNNATFDISSSQDRPTAINVVDHLIDVKILQSDDANVVAKTKVAEGYKVEVQVSKKKTVAQTAQITPIEKEKKDAWIEDNLAKDEVHLDNLEKKREEKIIAAAGILPSSPLYPVKQGINGAKDVIDQSSNAEKEIIKLKQKFQEAAALVAKSETEQGKKSLDEFTILFENAENKETLKPELEKLITDLQNDYLTVLPGTEDYHIKELLRDFELKIANNPEEILLKRNTEKLFEAQDLIDNGKIKLAAEVLANIDQNISAYTTSGATLAEEKKNQVLQKSEELQILQALKEDIQNSEESEELIALVDELHQNRVQEIDKLTPKPPKKVKPTKIVAIKKEDSVEKAQLFMKKVLVYKSQRGQNNQIITQLNRISNDASNLALLSEIKKLLPPEKQHLVTQKILDITK